MSIEFQILICGIYIIVVMIVCGFMLEKAISDIITLERRMEEIKKRIEELERWTNEIH